MRCGFICSCPYRDWSSLMPVAAMSPSPVPETRYCPRWGQVRCSRPMTLPLARSLQRPRIRRPFAPAFLAAWAGPRPTPPGSSRGSSHERDDFKTLMTSFRHCLMFFLWHPYLTLIYIMPRISYSAPQSFLSSTALVTASRTCFRVVI